MNSVNNNNGSLIYHIYEFYGKLKISVKFTNINGYITKGISSQGNSFCTIGENCRKNIELDMNVDSRKRSEYSLSKTIFLNSFEQKLFIDRLARFYNNLRSHSADVYRKNIIDGIEQFVVNEYTVRTNTIYESITFASGKNIEISPATDIDNNSTPYCGILMSFNHRSSAMIMSIDEFEYFINIIKSINLNKILNSIMQTVYLAELSGKVTMLNSPPSTQRYTVQRPEEYPQDKPYITPKAAAPMIPNFR
jgi:hypothetical protein